jgi:hypothetical protein
MTSPGVPDRRASLDRRRFIRVATLAACGGCSSLLTRRDALPERNAVTYDQLVIHSDVPLPSSHRLLEDLRILRVDVLQTLALPASDEPIHVYLFETEASFDEFMKHAYPKFPTRRAFFVENDTRLSVYAFWGDRVAEDLRHETTHGYLHSVVPNVPLWLDEGIAEYFEVPRGAVGLNRPHAEQLLSKLMTQGWRPNLSRLETMTAVGDMRQEDYAESWAWIHWLLNGDPQMRVIVQQYMQSLRAQSVFVPLSALVKSHRPEAEHQLCDHLFTLSSPPRAIS